MSKGRRGLARPLAGVLVLAVSVGLTAPAVALDLAQAKAQRLVAEGTDGLVHATQAGPSGAVQSLVAGTNAGRMDRYRDIAANRGISVDQVQRVAATELIKRTPPDQCVEADGGRYVRKGSGATCP